MTNLQERKAFKTVVVCGASSGIGAATAVLLAEQGFQVFLQGNRNLSGLQNIAKEVQNRSGQPSLVIAANLSDPKQCTSVVDAFWNQSNSGIVAWVHAAGADVVTGEAAQDDFETKLQKLIEVDVRGTILSCRAVAQRMQEYAIEHVDFKPAIVTLGWDQAPYGMEGDSGQYFCATKAAVMAFSQSLAKSFAPHVRVNCVAPGWVQTEWGNSATEFWDHRARNECLLHRWGKPSDVASVIEFLISDKAGFVNGQCLQVNGGWKPAWPTLDSKSSGSTGG